jgi:hypothetical protein
LPNTLQEAAITHLSIYEEIRGKLSFFCGRDAGATISLLSFRPGRKAGIGIVERWSAEGAAPEISYDALYGSRVAV